MLLLNKDSFKPSTALRTLAIMEAIADNPKLSQQELSTLSAMSSAMVNQYLKNLRDSNLIQYVRVNGKSYSYRLTPSGQGKRRELLGLYCTEIVQSYSSLKELVRKKLEPLSRDGIRGLALYGASETCEVVLSAIIGTDFMVTTLADSDPAKHGRTFHGHVIEPPSALENGQCQAVVITSFAKKDEIFEQLSKNPALKGLEIVRL